MQRPNTYDSKAASSSPVSSPSHTIVVQLLRLVTRAGMSAWDANKMLKASGDAIAS